MGLSPRSLFFFFLFILFIDSVTCSSCPIDFSYVQTFPWDSSPCQDPTDKSCCQTLLSLFGIGLAQYLKQTSMFYFPNETSSSSCLSDFQTKLQSLSFPRSLVSECLGNSTEFVVNPSFCAGIATTQDWIKKVGPTSLLDSSCNGDMTGLTRCGLCVEAGFRVSAQLASLDKNSTKCFYYAVFYAAGIVNEFGPEDPRTAVCILGLTLDSSATNKSKNLSKDSLYKWVFGSLGALVGVLMTTGLIIVYKKWHKKNQQKELHEEYVTGVKARVLPNTGAKWFSLAELEQATSGFPQRNMIGQGGYGVVFKGILSDGTVVAVKQILDIDSKGDEEFVNEVGIISNIRHRNLLSLRGCCVTSDQLRGKRRYLVYDFMPNGSLDDHLFKIESNEKRLSWPQRKNIILDVAKGLAYLHHGIKPAIYHRDIKATNILLDSEMKARVADFGLAKQSTEGQSHLTTRVAGTYGYLAPEYALYGQLTEKSDVYSFGIVILETMSGRKVLDTTNATNASTILITDWAWTMVKSGDAKGVFDEGIREEGPRGVMERFVLVGILCAHVMVALRPTIADALKMLEGDIDIPRLPDRPLPLSHESFRSSLLFSASISERSKGSSSISSM
ncbi:unnamed protein product [Camellia sinensis]